MEKLSMYLYGIRFEFKTDWKAPEHLFNKATWKAACRLERWIMRLQNFHFKVRHEAWKYNLAGALSRLSLTVEAGEADSITNISDELEIDTIDWNTLQVATKEDEALGLVKVALTSGDWSKVPLEYKVCMLVGRLSSVDRWGYIQILKRWFTLGTTNQGSAVRVRQNCAKRWPNSRSQNASSADDQFSAQRSSRCHFNEGSPAK